ncbi:MAG: ATP-binding cassette domain-containing protein [Peptostreptococcaceae bacterium]|nr:ATP-binding cassette domain-containing protein [Peptostreptococcaceae bacterium]
MERIQDFREQQYEKFGFEEAYREMGDLAFAMEGKVFSSADRERLLFSAEGIAVRKNQLIVVKGGNGTGKSTLSNLLTGFTDIEIFDGSLQLDPILAGASYLSRPILFADGDIKENMFGREIDPEVFEMLGISFADKIINESGSNLSFGEQQKLGLLRVLSSEAEVIILDEPFTNLDRESIRRVAAFIEKIKRGKTILAIMHSAEMDAFADLIFEIREGKLVSIKK